jgi:hypothetical protein
VTENPVDVIAAIRCVMVQLKVAEKERAENLNYEVRNIDTILSESYYLCAAYGVVFVPRVTRQWIAHLTINNRPWTDTHLEVEFDVYGPGGRHDKITVGPVLAIGRDNADKGSSKAHTQAFKIVLNQLFQIASRNADNDGITAEADVVHPNEEMRAAMSGLVEVIEMVSEEHRVGLRKYIRETFGRPEELNLEDIRKATLIAAGWNGSPPEESEED